MSDAGVNEAYAARVDQYSDLFGGIDSAAEQDRRLLLAWARSVDGPIVDVGCGPGQWTNFLNQHGIDIEGVDPVPAFIDRARQRFPGVAYRIGHGQQIGADDASLGGVLAWYSLIHTDPAEIGTILNELARCTRPGGSLAIGFFEGAELEPFEHAVTTAWFWPVEALRSAVERAGFVVTEVHTRTDPGARPQGALIARRRHSGTSG